MAAPPTTRPNTGKKGGKKPTPPNPPAVDPQTQKLIDQAIQQFRNSMGLLGPGQYGVSFDQLNRLFPQNQLGPNYSPAQLRQQAQAAMAQIFNPRIKSIRDTFERQGQLGTKNIIGYTGTYANRLGEIPVAIANANQQGLQQQAAVGGALADYMRNTGAEISGDLQNRLADTKLSEGQIAGTVGNAAGTGFLGSGEIAGLNAASLSRMADEGNAWLKWGQALPGIGILQGQQELGKFQGQLTDALMTQMGDLQANMAEQGVGLYQNMLDRDLQRRGLGLERSQAMAGFYGDSQQRKLNAALGQTSLLQNWAQMLINNSLEQQRLANDIYGTQAGIYGTDVSAWNAQNPPPATGADYPGEIKTKEDLRGSMFAAAYSQFTNGLTPLPAGSLPNARKMVMNFLRGQNSGPFALSDRELQILRDQILRAIGYKDVTTGGKTAPSSSGAQGQGNQNTGDWKDWLPIVPTNQDGSIAWPWEW